MGINRRWYLQERNIPALILMNGAGIYPIRACADNDALRLSTTHSIDE